MSRISPLQGSTPSARKVRSFGLIWILVFAGLLALDLTRGVAEGVLFWLKGGALTAGLIGIVIRSIWRFLFLAMSIITAPIGWLVSRCILAVIYFGILTPIGLALRLTGWDPLSLRSSNAEGSHWNPVTDSEENSHFRQF